MNDISTRFVIRSIFVNLEPHPNVIVECEKKNLPKGSFKI